MQSTNQKYNIINALYMKINNTTNLRIDKIHTQIMYNYAKIFALPNYWLLQENIIAFKETWCNVSYETLLTYKIRFALFAACILAKKSQKNLQPNKINILLSKFLSDF